MKILKIIKLFIKIKTDKKVKRDFLTLKHRDTLEILVNNYNRFISLEKALINKKEIKEIQFLLKSTDSKIIFENNKIKLMKEIIES